MEPLDEVLHFDAVTSDPETAAASDADSMPTWAVYEEATDTAIQTGNFTKRTSLDGQYRGTVTLSAANGFEVGKYYFLYGFATVNSVAGKGLLKSFRVGPAESSAGVPKVDVSHWAGTTTTTNDIALKTTLAKTTHITGFNDLDAGGVRTAVGLGSANLDTQLGDIPTVSEFNARTLVAADYFVVSDYTAPLDAEGIRTAVGLGSANLDTQLADLPTVSEFNARTLLAAAYGTAANQVTIINYIDTEVAAVLAAVDTEVAAIKAKTDNLPASPAASGDIPSASTVASQVRTELGTELARIDVGIGTRATPADVNAQMLDVVTVDTLVAGVTFAEALRRQGAMLSGVVSNAGTANETFKDYAESVNTIVVTVDASGNRTAVAYN